jgi:hypothetical protein
LSANAIVLISQKGRSEMDISVTEQALIAVVSGSLSAVVSAIVTYLSISVQVRKDLEAKYDLDLRAQRITVYKELWRLLEPLAKYARPDPFTPLGARELSKELRRWYFGTGGLFMSEGTRDAYFELQNGLRTFAEDQHRPVEQALGETEFTLLRDKGSTLRTRVTQDIGTRRAPIFGMAVH